MDQTAAAKLRELSTALSNEHRLERQIVELEAENARLQELIRSMVLSHPDVCVPTARKEDYSP